MLRYINKNIPKHILQSNNMPRQKSLKTVCVDSVLFFALFALAGHLTINFWERYTIQSELTTMKTSLYSLKDTITNIGKAYDNLHSELKELIQVVEPMPTKIVMPQKYTKLRDSDTLRCKKKAHLDRRGPRDIQVQAVLTNRNDKLKVGVGTLTDDEIIPSLMLKNKSTGPMAKSAATNTKNPLKSTGITSDLSNSDTNKYFRNFSTCDHEYNPKCNHQKHYRDFQHCRRVCRHNIKT